MSMLQPIRVGVCLFTLMSVTATLTLTRAQPSIPAMGNRAVASVATTPDYSFHSDFWLNLHAYLYGIAGGGPTDQGGFEEEETVCFATLPEAHAEGWQTAVAYYKEHMGERHHRRDPLMRSVRYTLTNLASKYDPDPQVAAVFDLLRGAAPAYRTCLWDMHNQRNRQRIAELVGLLVIHGPALQSELSHYYQERWPDPITVDVVSYSDYAGANTAGGPGLPPHMMLSSTEADMKGFSGLETVLHEASHAMFGFRRGTVTEQIHAASEALGEEPPGQLWHALSFYTSGEAVARVARTAGHEDFEPYAKQQGLFETAFRGYLEPIEHYWQPYLDGKVDLATAMSNMISNIYAEEE